MLRTSWRQLNAVLALVALTFIVGTLEAKPVARGEEPAGSVQRPRLVVLIVVDQFVPDYLVRFQGYLTGGLKTILENGAVFLNAEYGDAITHTAVGHAVVATGCHPDKTGIVANGWVDYDTGENQYCVSDPKCDIIGAGGMKGRSPANLRSMTLGDWMKASDPQTRAVSISRKDRSAILLGGQKADVALWFDTRSGKFVTSSYYAKVRPRWVEKFEAEHPTSSFYRTWEKLLPEEAYFASREDYFPAEGDLSSAVFPHRLSTTRKSGEVSYGAITSTPFSDEQLLQLAEAAVEGEALGQDEHTDLLALGLSATDAIGHEYGPLSQEAQDNVIRLDRNLGSFFQFLDKDVGMDNIVVGFTADHGVMPMPEELARRGFRAQRITGDDRDQYFRNAYQRIQSRLGVQQNLFEVTGVGLLLDKSLSRATGKSLATVASVVAEEVRKVSIVDAAFTRADLGDVGRDGEPYLRLFRNSFYPDRMADVFVVFKKYYLVGGGRTGTSHGSPHLYDRNVPVIFLGEGVKSGHHDEAIGVIDLAPTLARLAGVKPTGAVDGRVLQPVLVDGSPGNP